MSPSSTSWVVHSLAKMDNHPIVRVPVDLSTPQTIPEVLGTWSSFGPYWIYGTASVLEKLAGEVVS